jgi:hypothetical protein
MLHTSWVTGRINSAGYTSCPLSKKGVSAAVNSTYGDDARKECCLWVRRYHKLLEWQILMIFVLLYHRHATHSFFLLILILHDCWSASYYSYRSCLDLDTVQGPIQVECSGNEGNVRKCLGGVLRFFSPDSSCLKEYLRPVPLRPARSLRWIGWRDCLISAAAKVCIEGSRGRWKEKKKFEISGPKKMTHRNPRNP